MTKREVTAHKLADLDHVCFGSEAMSFEEWEKALHLNCEVFTESKNGCIVGMAVAKWGGRVGYLYSNAVYPEFRKQGIGTILVKKSLDFLRKFCDRIQAHTRVENEASQAVLRKCGFSTIEYVPDYYDDCEDAILWEIRV